jgi:hypothetical protein
MKPVGLNKDEIVQCLRAFRDKLDELIGELQDPATTHVSEARESLRKLKSSLHRDCERRLSEEGRQAMTEIEARSYFPAVREAVNILVEIDPDSMPNQDWYDHLSQAYTSIANVLDDLEHR